MGIGMASGDKRAVEAARQAVESPLLETTINGARGVLMNITGGPDLGLLEATEAAEIIQSTADPDANIIWGATIDEDMGDGLRITVIATGFEPDDEEIPFQAPKITVGDTKSPLNGVLKDPQQTQSWRPPQQRMEYAPQPAQTPQSGRKDSTRDRRSNLDVPSFLRNKE